MPKYIHLLLSILILLGITASANASGRPDVVHYHLGIDLSDLSLGELSGDCTLTLTTQEFTEGITLDLHHNLTVDAVWIDQHNESFRQEDDQIVIYKKIAAYDTLSVRIKYHGVPAHDALWGGFFITPTAAYNYGVGMQSDPPSFGRAWFPCVDSFTDRATYSFEVHVPKNFECACNGTITGIEPQADGTAKFFGSMHDPIPTYLVAISVADYATVNFEVNGQERNIPVVCNVSPERELHARSNFAFVERALKVFEERFGPYTWEKIGFSATPFRNGAMEHSTNISYPALCDSYDCGLLLIHEFSHQWFGDLVNCATEGDMWLNEGTASYCETIYIEGTEGVEAAQNYTRNNQTLVLTNTHIADSGYYAVYGIPHRLTYGSTVYDKGASIVHNLRGYLGDSLFFAALKTYFDTYKYSSITTAEFCDFMSATTHTDLHPFFDFWVYQPGFCYYALSASPTKKQNNQYEAEITIRQQLLQTKKFAGISRIDIGYFGRNNERHIEQVEFAGEKTKHTVLLPFDPKLIVADPYERINEAAVDKLQYIDKQKMYVFENIDFAIKNGNSEPYIVRAQKVFLPPPTTSQTTATTYWNIQSNAETQEASMRFMVEGAGKQLNVRYRPNNSTKEKKIKVEIKKENDVQFFELKGVKSGIYYTQKN